MSGPWGQASYPLEDGAVLVSSSDGVFVVHVDGTARIQTVDPARQPRLGASIERFAERTGLVVPLGRWVLRAACRAAAGWWKAVERDFVLGLGRKDPCGVCR